MITTQFVSCSETSCPMNQDKVCRAPFLMIDSDGKCLIKEEGPHDNKSSIDTYVEIRDCRCKKCNYWERNETMSNKEIEVGSCSLGTSMYFESTPKDHNTVAVCNDFKKQIQEPGFSATL